MTSSFLSEFNWPLESLSPSSIWFMKIKDLRVALFGAWTNRFSRSTKIPLFASTSPLSVWACGEFVLCSELVEGSKIWGGWIVMINIFLFLLLFFILSICFVSRAGGRFKNLRGTNSKDKSPKVPFHRITLSYSYFEEFEFWANSARSKKSSRKNISWTEMKSLLTKPSNVLPSYTSSQNSNFLYSEVDFLKRS